MGVTSGFSLLSSLFCRSCSLRSHFSSATSNFASAKRKRSQKQIARAHAGGGGRATRRLGAAAAVSDRTSHLPLRTSHQAIDSAPGKNRGGSRRGGGRATRRFGAPALEEEPGEWMLACDLVFGSVDSLTRLTRPHALAAAVSGRTSPLSLRCVHQAIDAAAHQLRPFA